jgi:hypothetical protein
VCPCAIQRISCVQQMPPRSRAHTAWCTARDLPLSDCAAVRRTKLNVHDLIDVNSSRHRTLVAGHCTLTSSFVYLTQFSGKMAVAATYKCVRACAHCSDRIDIFIGGVLKSLSTPDANEPIGVTRVQCTVAPHRQRVNLIIIIVIMLVFNAKCVQMCSLTTPHPDCAVVRSRKHLAV